MGKHRRPQMVGTIPKSHSTGGNHYGHRKNYHDDTSDQPRGNYRRNESQRGPYSRPSGTDRRNESPQGPYSRPSGTDRRNESQQGPYSRSSGADRYNQSQQGPYSRSSGADRYNQSQQGPRSSGPRNFGGPRSQGRPVHNQHDRRFTQRNESNDQQRPRERAQHHPSQPSGEHDKRGNEYHRGRPPYAEQFEGDYERFAYDEPVEVVNDESHPVHKPQRNRRPYQRKSYPEGHEKHVTRLPDGRVLKGSRPEQRKKAQFWGEIAQNTDELVEQVQPAPATSEQPVEEKSNTQAAVEQQDAAKKPHASRPATATRTRSTAKSKKADTTAKKPRSRGPKPSQRGFKWPTA